MKIEIDKSELRSYIRKVIQEYSPDDLSDITEKVVKEASAYAEGYKDCLVQISNLPVDYKAMKELIIQQASDYAINKILYE